MRRASFVPLAFCACSVVMLIGCGHRSRSSSPSTPARIGTTEKGIASWYGPPYHGRAAASGEIYDMELLTAAHKKFPFHTWVEVTNLRNGKQVNVRINDRGPFVHGRIIDLSLAAAREIDMVTAGVDQVRVRVIPPPSPEDVARSYRPKAPSASAPITATLVSQTIAAPLLNQTGTYAVQAGAFSIRGRAETFRSSLGLPDTRVIAPDQSSKLWRVWVGRNMNKDAAAALAEELHRSGREAVVITDTVPPID